VKADYLKEREAFAREKKQDLQSGELNKEGYVRPMGEFREKTNMEEEKNFEENRVD